MHILRISVITLYQHYFPADGEQLFGEEWGDEVESDRVESGANKKESFEDFSSKLSKVKEGGDLLSRIALQYHRRRRA